MFSSDELLNGITVDTQQLTILNNTEPPSYPELLKDDGTTTLFYVDDDQILGQKVLPQNIHIGFHSHLTITKDAEEKELLFDSYGQIIPVSSTESP